MYSLLAVLRGPSAQMHPDRARSMQAVALQRLQSSLKHMRSMFSESSESLSTALQLAEQGRMWRRYTFLLVPKAKLQLAFVRYAIPAPWTLKLRPYSSRSMTCGCASWRIQTWSRSVSGHDNQCTKDTAKTLRGSDRGSDTTYILLSAKARAKCQWTQPAQG